MEAWITEGFENKRICPYCHNVVGKLLSYNNLEFDFKYCPYCGKEVENRARKVFICRYGCSCEDAVQPVETDNFEHAQDYAYECAVESYQSYEGGDVMSFDEVCDEWGIIDQDTEEAWNTYMDVVNNDIYYQVTAYNYASQEDNDAIDEFGIYVI